jgi:hypothetical protein
MPKATLSLYAAAIALATGPALAGTLDAPEPDPNLAPAPAPVNVGPDWTGFYGGAQLGYGDVDTNVPLQGDGFIGGLTAGYDYDFGTWVVGGAIDHDWADISLGDGADLDTVWRAKLRAGYKVGRGLVYGTGGYANADVDTIGDDDGYFIGAGYEHMVTDQFSLGGEVLYHEFDNFSGTGADVDATTVQVRGTFRF